MHEMRNSNECTASTRVICLVQPDSAPDFQIYLTPLLLLLLSLSRSDRHVRWATPTLSSNFYAPNINNFVGFIVICAYFYVFTRADPLPSPRRDEPKCVGWKSFAHRARKWKWNCFSYTYLCLLTFIKMAFMASMRIIVGLLHQVAAWQVGESWQLLDGH